MSLGLATVDENARSALDCGRAATAFLPCPFAHQPKSKGGSCATAVQGLRHIRFHRRGHREQTEKTTRGHRRGGPRGRPRTTTRVAPYGVTAELDFFTPSLAWAGLNRTFGAQKSRNRRQKCRNSRGDGLPRPWFRIHHAEVRVSPSPTSPGGIHPRARYLSATRYPLRAQIMLFREHPDTVCRDKPVPSASG